MYPPAASNSRGAMLGAGQAASYGPTQPAPPPSTHIASALEAQDGAIARLHGAISIMEDRLACVTEPEPSRDLAGANKAIDSMHVLERIARHSNGVDAATNRIERLLQRLQV